MADSNNLETVANEICEQLGFRYIRKSGEGAFKETFHVEASDGIEQALKVYKAGFREERSDREIRAMRACDHSNIARLHAINHIVSSGNEHLYTLEEFLAGGTLTDRLMHIGLMDVPTVIRFGHILIDAVSHIAARHFVHRDLKPDNIMFRDGSDLPVIVDFGLVRDLSASSLTADWHVQGPGTPFYASPEQLNNNKDLIDWRSDQFSLGVVFSICTFAQHPFDFGDVAAALLAVSQRRSLPDEFLNETQRIGLTALPQMLEPWPVNRFRTPRELIDAWQRQGKS